ncbi:MAG: glycosyltransferase [Bacteroidetes bacterium]|nr:glycosyltransferase [Bacteroidota bacterium]
MNPICIIIPYYNEAGRFPLDEFLEFLSHDQETCFCLVNDGSSDDTMKMLGSLYEKYPERILVCNLPTNKGKAEAVRAGMIMAMDHYISDYFGYFDADLATRLEEASRFLSLMKEKPALQYVFGSRVAILGVRIERKLYRHLIGRIIATFISNILHLMVYDTQCGAKLFTRSLAGSVFQTPFITRWLFDVEILARIIGICGRDKVEQVVRELPVTSWIDKGGSKVSWTYGFRIFFDLLKIRNHYRKVLD